MTLPSPKTLGVGSLSLSLISVAAGVYVVSLPYRLSQAQDRLLQAAGLVCCFAAILALATGTAAIVLRQRRHIEGHGLLEIFSVVLAVLALVMAFMMPAQTHSFPHKSGGGVSPNKSLHATPVGAVSSAFAVRDLWPGVREFRR